MTPRLQQDDAEQRPDGRERIPLAALGRAHDRRPISAEQKAASDSSAFWNNRGVGGFGMAVVTRRDGPGALDRNLRLGRRLRHVVVRDPGRT